MCRFYLFNRHSVAFTNSYPLFYRFSRHKPLPFIWPASLLSGVEVDTEVRAQEESMCKIQLQYTERITQAAIEEPHIIDPNTRNAKNG